MSNTTAKTQKANIVTSMDDLMERVLATIAAVEEGTTSPANAHLALKGYNAVVAIIKVKLDHARMTGRLTSGSADIPNATIRGVVTMPLLGEDTK